MARPELLDRNGDGQFRRLLYNFFAFGSSLDEARARFAAYIGLSPTQYMGLIVISRSERELEIGVSQMASQLHLSSAFVTIEVNKLVRDGLVMKMPHSSDGRRVRLAVTPLDGGTFDARAAQSGAVWQRLSLNSRLPRNIEDLRKANLTPSPCAAIERDNALAVLSRLRRAA